VKTEPIGMVESPAIPNCKGFPSLHLQYSMGSRKKLCRNC
jgi:hypothetical protein